MCSYIYQIPQPGSVVGYGRSSQHLYDERRTVPIHGRMLDMRRTVNHRVRRPFTCGFFKAANWKLQLSREGFKVPPSYYLLI